MEVRRSLGVLGMMAVLSGTPAWSDDPGATAIPAQPPSLTMPWTRDQYLRIAQVPGAGFPTPPTINPGTSLPPLRPRPAPSRLTPAPPGTTPPRPAPTTPPPATAPPRDPSVLRRPCPRNHHPDACRHRRDVGLRPRGDSGPDGRRREEQEDSAAWASTTPRSCSGDQGPPSVRTLVHADRSLDCPQLPRPAGPRLHRCPAPRTPRSGSLRPGPEASRSATTRAHDPRTASSSPSTTSTTSTVASTRRLGALFSSMQVYRYILGIEKTFWDGNASIGIRMPINNMSATSTIRGLGGTTTAINNLTVFTKFILWQDPTVTNRLISAGLAVTVPSGPGASRRPPTLLESATPRSSPSLATSAVRTASTFRASRRSTSRPPRRRDDAVQ